MLNKTEKVGFVDSNMNEYIFYVSAYTDQNQKVFEISDEPSKNIFETDKDRRKREKSERQELEEQKLEDVSLSSSIALNTGENEDGQEHLEDEESRT